VGIHGVIDLFNMYKYLLEHRKCHVTNLLRVESPGFNVGEGEEIILSRLHSDQIWGLSQWVIWAALWVKGQECEDGYSCQLRAKIKNVWHVTSTHSKS
jgi:hypothetical protein